MIDRIVDIITKPTGEYWQSVSDEQLAPKGVLFGYLLPLTALAVVLPFSFMTQASGVGPALLFIGDWITGVVLLSLVLGVISNRLAPLFGGESRGYQGFVLFALLHTPVLLSSLLGVLLSLAGGEIFGSILAKIGLFYGIYLMWISVPVFYKVKGATEVTSDWRVPGFAVTVAVFWFSLRSVSLIIWGLAYQLNFAADPIQEAIEAQYSIGATSMGLLAQHDFSLVETTLLQGNSYRFIGLSEVRTTVSLSIVSSTGEHIEQSTSNESSQYTYLDFEPIESGTYLIQMNVGELTGAGSSTESAVVEMYRSTTTDALPFIGNE
tara:strand:- start:171 stop:1136 length:966 start_codon:yes stop_codon:yes gene_type:complete